MNAVVGETNDGGLNDIRGMHVRREHVLEAIRTAKTDRCRRQRGRGHGDECFGWKGGIGTSSRRSGGYTVGVLVQSNFGGHPHDGQGAPVGRELDPCERRAAATGPA